MLLPRTNRDKKSNGYHYHIFRSKYHLKSNCSQASSNSSGVSDDNTSDKEEDANRSPITDDGWRYCVRADENSTLVMYEVIYYFCNHCVCKRTKTKGFFNRTHTSSKD